MTRTRLFLHGRRLVMNDLHARWIEVLVSKINLVIRLTSIVHCLASSGAAFSNCFNLKLASSGSRLLLCRWLDEDVRLDEDVVDLTKLCEMGFFFVNYFVERIEIGKTICLRNHWEISCYEAYEAGRRPIFHHGKLYIDGICVNLDFIPTLFLLFLTVNE